MGLPNYSVYVGKPLVIREARLAALIMEACLAVEREHEKVVKKLRTVSGSATEKLQRVLDQIQALKSELLAGRKYSSSV